MGINKKLTAKIVIWTITFFIVIGLFTALVTNFWSPFWSPFRPSPEETIGKVSNSMRNLESLHFDINVKGKADISYNGNMNMINSLYPRSNVNWDISAGEFKIAGETKNIEGISYFNLAKLEVPDKLESYFRRTSITERRLAGTWFRFDKKMFMDMLETIAIGKNYISIEKPAPKETIGEKLMKLIENKDYQLKEELKDQKINGKRAYHYLIAINKEKAKELVSEIVEEANLFEHPFEGYKYKGIIKTMNENITKNINDFFENADEITVELWIGKWNKLLYKAELKAGSIESSIVLSGFNQPVNIEIPDRFDEFEQSSVRLMFFIKNFLVKL